MSNLLQQVLRLQQIQTRLAAIYAMPPPAADGKVDPKITKEERALQEERNAIFFSCSMPPPELAGHQDDPNAWAHYFLPIASMAPHETVAAWFDSCMMMAEQRGAKRGIELAKDSTAIDVGTPALIKAIELVRAGLKAGKIRSALLEDPNTKKRRPLEEYLTEALLQAHKGEEIAAGALDHVAAPTTAPPEAPEAQS